MSFLKQPYPYFHKNKILFRNTFLILLLVFLFEYLIEPFERTPSEHLFPYAIICIIHAGNAAIIYYMLFTMVNLFVNEDDWALGHEVISVAILLLLIGLGGYFIRDFIYDNPNNHSLQYLLEEVRNAYLVGSILFFTLTRFNYDHLTRKNVKKANQLHISNISENNEQNRINIKTNQASDDFHLFVKNLMLVKSDGNYLEFYIKEKGEIYKLIKRMTLQSAAQQLSGYNFIIKTHRAYLVNLHRITKISGNAQGYKLTLEDLDFNVPVSRSNVQAFNEMMG
ncbi:MAG TPA: LytR/AlgR family response regulator transcription factor [Cyclobacteriaceae bacterium]